MSEQRIDTGAEAATSGDADTPQPTVDRRTAGAAGDTADTEGASGLQDAYQAAADQQRSEPDLGGREPAGDDAARPSLAPGAAEGSTRPARAETGEVSAEPSPERRAEDPGSVATEFGDRADSAPEDEIAHPSI